MAVDKGTLLIADIGGYTKFLTGVELEHSHDILADLLGVVNDHLSEALTLAKLEGDAVFCYDRHHSCDASKLIATIESCYFAFHRRLQNIDIHSSCTCDACAAIPSLSIKFLAHFGEYVVHSVAGREELVGSDVITVHRLLKNHITEKTGLQGYAFVTDPVVGYHELIPDSLGMTPYSESYDDVGEVGGYLLDLQQRWEEEKVRSVVYLGPDEGQVSMSYLLPVSPALVWDYLTDPTKRRQWQVGVTRIDQQNPAGVRGVGTINHCVHGKSAIFEEIVDWKPFRYFTIKGRGPGVGPFLMTQEVAPVETGTEVTVRMKAIGGFAQRMAWALFGKKMQESFGQARDNLIRLVTEENTHLASTR